MKKAQGISMNVIVIAAIALLVLVILALITTGRLGLFSKGVTECRNQGGVCADEGANCGDVDTNAENYPTEYSGASCGENSKCCLPITT